MTGKMLAGIESILMEESPNLVLVYGDTNSTLAGALAAKKLHIKVAHVEAGLRSFNMEMPEEINRILTDRISDLLFCPTDLAKKNLLQEGINNSDARIVRTGDIMLDAAIVYRDASERPESVPDGDFVLCTVHRAENTNSKERASSIFSALEKIAKKQNVVLPLHPRTREFLKAYGIRPNDSITLLEPVGYLEMLWLLNHCKLVITDSGGLQKEAYFFKKPCVTIREETEWVELVEAGVNTLAGAEERNILDAFDKYAIESPDFSSMLYGTGKTRETILHSILDE
jgi:UDP-GlcNAc3NAcA epimerase